MGLPHYIPLGVEKGFLRSNTFFTSDEETGNSHTEHTDTKTDETRVDMYIVIIAVVSVLAFIFLTTLCLLFACFRKSPLCRCLNIFRRGAQQQRQPEYDDVPQNKFQAVTPSDGGTARHHGVVCVTPALSTTVPDYTNTITSDYDNYDEISSNKSPGSTKRMISTDQVSPSSSAESSQSELMKSTRSNPRSPQLGDRYGSLSSQQDRHTRPPLQKPIEYKNTLLTSTSNAANASSTEPMSPVNAEDSVSVILEDLTIVDVQPGVYKASSPTRCLPVAEAAVCRRVLSVTEDYAHLNRPGEEPPLMDNIYDG